MKQIDRDFYDKLFYYLSYLRKVIDTLAVILMLIQESLFGNGKKKKVRGKKKK